MACYISCNQWLQFILVIGYRGDTYQIDLYFIFHFPIVQHLLYQLNTFYVKFSQLTFVIGQVLELVKVKPIWFFSLKVCLKIFNEEAYLTFMLTFQNGLNLFCLIVKPHSNQFLEPCNQYFTMSIKYDIHVYTYQNQIKYQNVECATQRQLL